MPKWFHNKWKHDKLHGHVTPEGNLDRWIMTDMYTFGKFAKIIYMGSSISASNETGSNIEKCITVANRALYAEYNMIIQNCYQEEQCCYIK